MVQSLERAFAILDEVAAAPAGVTAIAERVELPKMHGRPLARGARGVDAVERFDGVRLRIGPGRRRAHSRRPRPSAADRDCARPCLVELVRVLGEDAGLGFPDGNEVRYVDQVESDNAVQVRDWTGTRAPLHAAPSGLVLLADWPQDALAAYLGGTLASLSLDGPIPTRRGSEAPAKAREGRLCLGARGVRGGNRLGRGADSRRRGKADRGHSLPRALRIGSPAGARSGSRTWSSRPGTRSAICSVSRPDSSRS